ncbi:ribosomal-protein-alanine N-acetyltransferase [Lactobacillus sp.] [Lactiplantibacillus mudanjiangensis]|uniref:ribosomal protein S18-alanine N-acetyltransferase n=1 Tax=Lactiplantibacillus mudanjiangensis TaxID=1296538 RepID=UPI001013E8D0|nr:ribosomal protein S18-alanine N-acetyltransferase [Lactiplantibacillus mudanjiangensis]VDG17967.1 ribosomal-protein-alanine N-acetyltransferase [Lactobacillus sp.] [Lactiplantibacillus mudanjiangensis]VDG32330.1 ribosomal-protein-alanine N-acetyltransferase [Lactobacillus sp.] [Lactiplantibacillus mudanjiangensis]
MLRRFKQYFHKLNKTHKHRRQKVMTIENHIVPIGQQSYYVSRALITDVPEMLAIERAVYAGKTPWDENAFKTELRRQSGRFYIVMRHEDRLCAFCGCAFDDRRQDAHITNIAVHPDFQKQGLGHFLMKTMIERATYLKYRTVTLEVRYSNVAAQRLYLALGFEKTGIKKRYYFGDHEDAIDMTYRLPEATPDV